MSNNQYITSLLKPIAKANTDKKVWSIGLNTVWLPFFTATNVEGNTEITPDVLGNPLRLQYDKSGAVRFSVNGKPVIRVAKELSDNIGMVRANFEANLVNHANTVKMDNASKYAEHQRLCVKMATPIIEHDRAELTKAIEALDNANATVKSIQNDVIAQAESVVKAKAPKAKKAKAPKAPAPAPETPAPAPETPAIKETVSVS
jgi:hypothetical protein